MYKRIMIVLDQHEGTRAALDEGLRLADAHGGEVTFFTALPRAPLPITDAPYHDPGAQLEFDAAARTAADELLARARAAAEKAGVMSHEVAVGTDDEVSTIVELALRRRCEVIVVGSEGQNAVVRLLTGSVVPGLITSSPVPVLVCKPPEAARGAPPRRN